jgi:hypothetical protein
VVGESVAAEIEEQLRVGAGVGARGEGEGVPREERFREEEDGEDEGDAGADGADPVVPAPAEGLAEIAADWRESEWLVRDWDGWVDRLTYGSDVGAVCDEYGVDPSGFSALVEKEHVVHTRCADGHHAAESDTADGARADKGREGRDTCGCDTSNDGQHNSKESDWSTAVDVRKRRIYEWRETS